METGEFVVTGAPSSVLRRAEIHLTNHSFSLDQIEIFFYGDDLAKYMGSMIAGFEKCKGLNAEPVQTRGMHWHGHIKLKFSKAMYSADQVVLWVAEQFCNNKYSLQSLGICTKDFQFEVPDMFSKQTQYYDENSSYTGTHSLYFEPERMLMKAVLLAPTV